MKHPILELLEGHQAMQSDQVTERFAVMAAGGTTDWGRLQQARRELRTAFDAAKRGELVVRRAKRHLLRIAERVQAATPETLGDLDIDWSEAQMDLEEAEARQAELLRRFRHLVGLTSALREKVGPVTPERAAALERVRIFEDLRTTMGLEAYAGCVRHETIRAIAQLPPAEREDLMRTLEDTRLLKIAADRAMNGASELPDAEAHAPRIEEVAKLCRLPST